MHDVEGVHVEAQRAIPTLCKQANEIIASQNMKEPTVNQGKKPMTKDQPAGNHGVVVPQS